MGDSHDGSSGVQLRSAELQRAISYLEAFPAMPGGGDEFTEERLALLRAERVEALAAESADKNAGLSGAARLRREANTASKMERKVAAAKKAVGESKAERLRAEDQLQQAHDWLEQAHEEEQAAQQRLASLEAEAEAAHAKVRLAAPPEEGPALRGLFVQMRHLEAAFTAGNFPTAWTATLQQMEAVEVMLDIHEEEAPEPAPAGRQQWADSCPMVVHSDSDLEPFEPQSAADRGQAERSGAAAGAWARASRQHARGLAADAADLAPLAAGRGEQSG